MQGTSLMTKKRHYSQIEDKIGFYIVGLTEILKHHSIPMHSVVNELGTTSPLICTREKQFFIVACINFAQTAMQPSTLEKCGCHLPH